METKTITYLFVAIFIAIICNNCSPNKEIATKKVDKDSSNFYQGNSGFFIDTRDGKKYKWVRIGEQIWMAENLAFKADSGCVAYKHKNGKVKKYGYYYSWKTAMKACPEGWHLPSKEDIKDLIQKLGNSDYYAAFDSLQKNNDFDLNLRRTGYYDVDDDQFYLYYKFPYLGEARFWTGYFETSLVSGKLEPYYFNKQYFWRRAYVNNFYYECYHPVRCIKD